MMVCFTIKEKDIQDLNIICYIKAEAYDHQSDILNAADYRLNNEFVKEYFKKKDDILAFTYTYGGVRMCKDLLLKRCI